jgi:hypothetical protein
MFAGGDVEISTATVYPAWSTCVVIAVVLSPGTGDRKLERIMRSRFICLKVCATIDFDD